jgi:hypothetical protein
MGMNHNRQGSTQQRQKAHILLDFLATNQISLEMAWQAGKQEVSNAHDLGPSRGAGQRETAVPNGFVTMAAMMEAGLSARGTPWQWLANGRRPAYHLLSFKPKDTKETDYIFPGKSKEGHLVGAPKIWSRIAKRANVKGVHGLRHWFASAGAELGFSDIIIIGAIIGHAKKGMTGHYATAPDSALIMAADRISQYLADALDGGEAGKVLRFRA